MNRVLKLNIIYLIISGMILTNSMCNALEDEAVVVINQYLAICDSNQVNSVVYKFNVSSDYTYSIDDNETFGVNRDKNLNLVEVVLKKPLSNDSFSVVITMESTKSTTMIKIAIYGVMTKSCENSYTSICTVIIAFLASLCLIIFTALALTLIILRRKKPITFNFGQNSDRENNDRVTFKLSNNESEENLEESRKQSVYDTSNGVINQTNDLHPRKSSLKPPKSVESTSEQIVINNNHKKSSAKTNPYYENAAYAANELEIVDEEFEDKLAISPSDEYLESKRKSIVTFSDRTDIYK